MSRVASSTSKERCAYVMGFISMSREKELKIPLDRFFVSSTHFEPSSLPELFAQQVDGEMVAHKRIELAALGTIFRFKTVVLAVLYLTNPKTRPRPRYYLPTFPEQLES